MKWLGILLAVILTSMSLVGAEASPAQRFAVVNLEKIFQEYYKSRIAEDAIKEQAEVFRNTMMRLNEELRLLKEEVRTARINMDNIALSDEDRTTNRENLERKNRQISEKEADIEYYMKQRNTEMEKIIKNKREAILADIKKEIQRRAVAEGYDFVLDSSNKTMSDQPLVLLFPERFDLTEAVITELNRTRTAHPSASSSPKAIPPSPVPTPPNDAKNSQPATSAVQP